MRKIKKEKILLMKNTIIEIIMIENIIKLGKSKNSPTKRCKTQIIIQIIYNI